jgi:transposase
MASLELTPDYSAIYLFPPSLEDWIPPTHEARLIRDLVETMPLKDLGFHQRETTEGRPSYSSSLLLSIWLYGMLLKVRSSRQLERACRDYLPMIWLTGRLTPDHNTIARFFNAHQTEFPKLFTAIVQAAAAAGHVGMALHAIDGTKIRSRSSNRTVSLKQRLAESRKEIEESFTRLTAAVAATDAEEDRIIEALTGDGTGGGAGLSCELQDAKERIVRVHEELQIEMAELLAERSKLEKVEQAMKESGATMINASEPDARMMKLATEPISLGYNAQIVVDDKLGLIVAERVTNEQTDQHLMMPMLDEVRASLGSVATDTVGDAGYGTVRTLLEAEAAGVSITVALPSELTGKRRGAYHASQFTHDPVNDVMLCPEQKSLSLHKHQKRYNAKDEMLEQRVYRCNETACPVQSKCTKSAHRIVTLNPARHLVEQQQARQQPGEPGREHLRRRRVIVEPVFAILKHHWKFRRFSGFGIRHAQAEWSINAIGYNLTKLLPIWRTGNLGFL